MTATAEPPIEGASCCTPSDRDLLLGLLDGLMSISERLFPDERMVIKLIATQRDGQAFAEVTGPTLTRWEPR